MIRLTSFMAHGELRRGLLGVAILAVGCGAPAPSGIAAPSDPAPVAASASPDALEPLPSATDAPAGSPGAPSSLGALIEALPVAAEHRGGYKRSLFHLWIDADHDGCNTRREVLLAQAVVVPKVGLACWFVGGAWVSPYDGLRVTSIGKLDIDHVVPLAEAWRSGAWAWMPARREAYANDLGVPYALLAVTSATDREKGDKEPGAWLPPLASERCVYVVDWVAVKTRWRLTVDPGERADLLRLAAGCGSTPIPAVPAPDAGAG